jgi:hypothetical protein
MGNGKTNHRERRGHREISRSAQIKLTGEGRHLSFVICHWSLVIGQSSIVNCHWSFVISFSPPLPLVPLVPRVQEQLDIVLSAFCLLPPAFFHWSPSFSSLGIRWFNYPTTPEQAIAFQ